MENKNCYLFFRGYYAVLAASRILVKYGIENRVVRAPVRMRDGCNFALVTDAGNEEKCVRLLEREKIVVEARKYT